MVMALYRTSAPEESVLSILIMPKQRNDKATGRLSTSVKTSATKQLAAQALQYAQDDTEQRLKLRRGKYPGTYGQSGNQALRQASRFSPSSIQSR